jgi:hypothetical protein
LRVNSFAFLTFLLAGQGLLAGPQATLAGPPSSDRSSEQLLDQADPGAQASAGGQQKQGSLNVFGGWRFRSEAWDWFQPTSGQNSYGFAHSLLRAGIGQTRERFDWLIDLAGPITRPMGTGEMLPAVF